ncbi:MAG TPA: hypothetical protein VND68_15150 [Chloroflexia bacterium]|jgi:hypothetical protein|nr:hypothetical protein [Chloroflexia bacterium]
MNDALVGLVGLLVGILITRGFEVFDKRTENQKWFLENLLPRQIDALADLHVRAIEAHDNLMSFPITLETNRPMIERLGHNNPQAKPFLNLVRTARTTLDAKTSAFHHAAAKADIYMPDDESRRIVQEYVNAAHMLETLHHKAFHALLTEYAQLDLEFPTLVPTSLNEEAIIKTERAAYKLMTDTLHDILRPPLLARYTFYKPSKNRPTSKQ